jgi:cytochrome c-type biogenesis protein CcmH
MSAFLVLASALTLGAIALIAVPLLKRTGALPRAPGVALGAAGVIAIGAVALYGTLSNASWQAPAPANTPQAMVGKLARRLEQAPEDLNGWLLLGRSYTVLEQFPLAARAYQRADRLAHGKNVDALIGLAEALALANEAQLNGRAGRLIEQALTLDPKSGKALYYGAAAALHRGDLALARQRFASLLALDPPENVKPILQAQIAAIDRKLMTPPLPH